MARNGGGGCFQTARNSAKPRKNMQKNTNKYQKHPSSLRVAGNGYLSTSISKRPMSRLLTLEPVKS